MLVIFLSTAMSGSMSIPNYRDTTFEYTDLTLCGQVFLHHPIGHQSRLHSTQQNYWDTGMELYIPGSADLGGIPNALFSSAL